MIILALLVSGDESPSSPPVPLPVETGVEPEDVPELRDPARLSEDRPLSMCWVMVALVEDEPGFVVPKA